MMKSDYENQIAGSTKEITELEIGLKEFEAQTERETQWTVSMTHLQSGGELSAELINRLVDRIEIHHDKSITVTCKEYGETGALKVG
jgi:hypothetical protein